MWRIAQFTSVAVSGLVLLWSFTWCSSQRRTFVEWVLGWVNLG